MQKYNETELENALSFLVDSLTSNNKMREFVRNEYIRHVHNLTELNTPTDEIYEIFAEDFIASLPFTFPNFFSTSEHHFLRRKVCDVFFYFNNNQHEIFDSYCQNFKIGQIIFSIANDSIKEK